TEGRLVTKHEGKVIDVPLEHTDVHIRVDGHLAEATVKQRFKNPFATKIEAVYLFPLPTGAAIGDLTIKVGTRTIRGSLKERAQAKATYEAARKKGLVAALLTQERPNLFTQSIANLEPSATIEVELRYVQRLDYQAGEYELVFPMVAGPRYVPEGAKADFVQAAALPPGLRSSHDISLAVELDAGVAIERVASASHRIELGRPAPARATVRIAAGDTIPNKDFTLRYRVAGAAPKLGVLAHRGDAGPGSFVLIAQPPAHTAPAQIAARELVFVLDTSSSMRGAALTKAKQLIASVLGKLRPDDTFQIVRFDDRASALGAAPIANKPANVRLILDWLAKLDAGGGTEMITGIETALAVPHDLNRLRIVAFLTDGYVGNEDQILALVGNKLGASRLFSFGVGSAVNRYLLEEMAAIGRGAVQVVRTDEDTAAAVATFERKIDAATLTDIRIDWGGLAIEGVTPHAIPDLFVGQPLVLAGHYTRAGTGTITVHGKQAGRDVRFMVPVTLPERANRPAVAAVWARARIAELSRKELRAVEPATATALKAEIVALSLAHRVLTKYTAFVAVDDSRVTAGGAAKKVVVPIEVPESARQIGAGWGTIGTGSYGTIGYGSGFAAGHSVTISAAGGMAGRSVAVPQVTIAMPTASGDLDRTVIRRYVKRHIEKIRYCYEKELLRTPKLAGTVTTQFTLDEGLVVAATASGLGNKEVETCIAGVIKNIEFPKVPGGGLVQVNYPFTLRPSEVTP
ncbi:MAG TPA: VIT domain-containing protein, partial [Kofleriaceae bacterium]